MSNAKKEISQSPVSTVSVVLKFLLKRRHEGAVRRDFHAQMFSRSESIGLTKGFLCCGHVLPVNYGRNTKNSYSYTYTRQLSGSAHLTLAVALNSCRTTYLPISSVFDHFSKIWRPWVESPQDYQRKRRPRYTVSYSISTTLKCYSWR